MAGVKRLHHLGKTTFSSSPWAPLVPPWRHGPRGVGATKVIEVASKLCGVQLVRLPADRASLVAKAGGRCPAATAKAMPALQPHQLTHR